ncbi:MAG: hypothetical protein LC725_09680 [Lentisphaerae bacterium]|nr:hypothetical protein [Lentisphaerota bacterium]
MQPPESKLNPGQVLPTELGLIAGRGAYPRLLAESARSQGVRRLFVIAFKHETDRALQTLADEICWLNFGQLEARRHHFRRRQP